MMDLFTFTPETPVFPVIEVDGIRAIVEATSWRSFYAIDDGRPFPSETGFRSAGSMVPGISHEQAFRDIIAEQTKGTKGKKGAEGPKKALPIPATVYRLPYAGETKPQPWRGQAIAQDALRASPLNPVLILEVYGSGQSDGPAWGAGNSAKLIEVTQSLLPDGFRAESDAAGQGFAVIAPSGARVPPNGFFPAFHNARCHVARALREATRASAPSLFPPRRPRRSSAPMTLFAAE